MKLSDLLVSGESEVSYFEVHLFIYQNILEFKVSVNNSFLLHITNHIKHLRQEEPSRIFSHATNCLTQVEKKSSSDILKHDEDKVLDFSS